MWILEVSGHVITNLQFKHPLLALEAACQIVGYKRNVKVVAPNGARLDVWACSLLTD